MVATASLARGRARVSDDPTQPRPAFEVTDLAGKLFLAHDRVAVPPRRDRPWTPSTWRPSTCGRRSRTGRPSAALPADVRDAAEADLEDRRRALDALERDLKVREPDLKAATDRYTVEITALTSPVDRAAMARRYGLVREAIVELRKAQEQFQKQLGDRGDQSFPPAELANLLAVHAELIELLWYDGKVEESAQILDTVDTPEVLRIMDTPAVRQEYVRVRQRALGLMFRRPAVPSSPYDADPAGHFRNLRRALAASSATSSGRPRSRPMRPGRSARPWPSSAAGTSRARCRTSTPCRTRRSSGGRCTPARSWPRSQWPAWSSWTRSAGSATCLWRPWPRGRWPSG